MIEFCHAFEIKIEIEIELESSRVESSITNIFQ